MAGSTTFPVPWCSTGISAFNTMTATTHGAALIMQIPDAGNIDAIAFRTAAAATPVPMTVRVEGVTAAGGVPDGSLIHANATGTMGGNVSANAVTVVTFTAAVAVTRGQLVALVVQPSTSPVSVQMATVGPTGGPWPGGGFPYPATNTSGSWSKSNPGMTPIAVRYDSGDYVWAGIPIPVVSSFTNRAISTGTGASTGTRRGIRFRLDQDFTLEAVWLWSSIGSTADFTIELYSDAGSSIATLSTVDANQILGTGNQANVFLAGTSQSLTANTWYRLAFVPITANSLTVYEAATTVAALIQTLAGPGVEVQQTAYVSSAWVDTDTSTTLMGIVGTAQSAPGGGGGGTYTAGPRLIGGGLVG
jgi:hypothetical protein